MITLCKKALSPTAIVVQVLVAIVLRYLLATALIHERMASAMHHFTYDFAYVIGIVLVAIALAAVMRHDHSDAKPSSAPAPQVKATPVGSNSLGVGTIVLVVLGVMVLGGIRCSSVPGAGFVVTTTRSSR